MHPDDPAPQAAVVHANRFQFLPRQVLANPSTPTRLLLWGRAGGGSIEAGGRTYRLTPGRFVILPSPHTVTYRADPRDPFLIAGIHLVPRHPLGPIRMSTRADQDRRGDLPLPDLTRTVDGDLTSHPRLAYLVEHVLAVFESGFPEEWQVRLLGRLLARELSRLGEIGILNLPILLAELQRRLQADLARERDLDHLARLAGVSTATLGRLCRRHLAMSPCRWLTQLRIERAAHLVSATALPLAEIGRQVGIDDPYRFSRLFSRTRGRSAREVRRSCSGLG